MMPIFKLDMCLTVCSWGQPSWFANIVIISLQHKNLFTLYKCSNAIVKFDGKIIFLQSLRNFVFKLFNKYFLRLKAELSLHLIVYKSAFICLEGLQYLYVQQILLCNNYSILLFNIYLHKVEINLMLTYIFIYHPI